MITFKNIELNFSDKTIFSRSSLFISANDKIGLIGRNGSGKTTLLNLLVDKSQFHYNGTIEMAGNPSIGYLPQQTEFTSGESLLNFARKAMKEIIEIETAINKLEILISTVAKDSEEYKNKAIELSELYDRYRHYGGYDSEARAGKILSGLGFMPSEFGNPLSTFSGGWQMRAYLAQLLLADNDILLLDEPTNHLDIESLVWLENYLKNTDAVVIIISHDYTFLDKIVNQTVAIERTRLIKYSGNISAYEAQREEMIKLLESENKSKLKEIEKIEKFINRFRYKASKARQVQSRIKKLDKIDLEIIPVEEAHHFNFNFPEPPAVAKEIIQFSHVNFHYPGQTNLLDDIDLKCYRGEKYALIGKNGTGKSTLVKLVAGLLEPIGGSVILNERTKIGYFAQHTIENLNKKLSIFDEISNHADPVYANKIRDILGLFMFSGDDQFKNIEILSGGEKARVALAKLFVSPANFLILDEPTNHLDIESKQVLIEAINQFPGTAIIISHDEDLLEQAIENILYIDAGRLKKFEGNYTQYMEFIRKRVLSKNDESNEEAVSISANQEKRLYLKGLERDLNKLLREIAANETQIHLIEEEQEKNKIKQNNEAYYLDGKKAHNLQQEIEENEAELEQLMKKWEDLNLKIDRVKSLIAISK